MLAADGAAQDSFGRAAALDGNVALIGAQGHDAMRSNSGAAYIFRYDGKQWLQEQKLLASDGQAGDFFGQAVAVQGDVALVGANGDDDAASNAGAVYVFRYNSFTRQWVQEQKLLPDPNAAARFGESLSLSGSVALVGANLEDFVGSDGRGAAYFFEYDGSQWVRRQKLMPDEAWAHQFGKAVSIDGNWAVIGAWESHPYTGASNGAAYVYRLDSKSAQWVQHGPVLLAPPPPVGGPFFGWSVSISGTTAVVGAYGEDGQRGAAYVYNIDPAPADLNCDGVINTLDLGVVLSNWSIPPTSPACAGDTPCPADINGDGFVNTLDLGMLLSSWTL